MFTLHLNGFQLIESVFLCGIFESDLPVTGLFDRVSHCFLTNKSWPFYRKKGLLK